MDRRQFHRGSNVYTSVKGGGRGEKRQRRRRRRRRRQPRQRPTLRGPRKASERARARRRGRIFSIWADGNLRLLHIGLCTTEVLCNSQQSPTSSLSFLPLDRSSSSSSFPSSAATTISSSSPSFVFPPVSSLRRLIFLAPFSLSRSSFSFFPLSV